MSLYSRVKVWIGGQILTAGDLDAEFDNILDNSVASSMVGASANATASNLTEDPGGPGTEVLAVSIADELEQLRFELKRIKGTAQWRGPLVTVPTRTLESIQIASTDIAANSITTAKIVDNAVTLAKLATVTPQSANFSVASSLQTGSNVALANVNLAVLANRPVFVYIDYDLVGNQALADILAASSTSVDSFLSFTIKEDASTIFSTPIDFKFSDGVANSKRLVFQFPFSAISKIHFPSAAGTKNYALTVSWTGLAGVGGTYDFEFAGRLTAFQI